MPKNQINPTSLSFLKNHLPDNKANQLIEILETTTFDFIKFGITNDGAEDTYFHDFYLFGIKNTHQSLFELLLFNVAIKYGNPLETYLGGGVQAEIKLNEANQVQIHLRAYKNKISSESIFNFGDS